MRQLGITCPLLAMVALAGLNGPASATPLPARGEDAPVSATLLRRHIPQGKIAWRNDIRLTLRNRRDEPIWLVLRGRPDQPLNATGRFRKHNSGQPFVKKVHSGAKGAAIELYFFAQDGFTAFHLAPGARVDLASFPLIANDHVHDLEVWEVRDLKVNGASGLADWLPVDVRTTHSVSVPDSTETKWQALCDEADQPTESIHFIQADVLRRWSIALEK